MIERTARLEDHVGIKPATKLTDLSKKGLYDATHPQEKWNKMDQLKKSKRYR